MMKVENDSHTTFPAYIQNLGDGAISIELNDSVHVVDDNVRYSTRSLELTAEQTRAHRRHVMNAFCKLDPKLVSAPLSSSTVYEAIWPEAAEDLQRASTEWKQRLIVDDQLRLTHAEQEQWPEMEDSDYQFPTGVDEIVILPGGHNASYPSNWIHSSNNPKPDPGWSSAPAVSTEHDESMRWRMDPVERTSRRHAVLSNILWSCTNHQLVLTAEQLEMAKPVFEQALSDLLTNDENRKAFMYDTTLNPALAQALDDVGTSYLKDQGITCESQLLLGNHTAYGSKPDLDLPEHVLKPFTRVTFKEQAEYRLSKLTERPGRKDDASNIESAAKQMLRWVDEDLLPTMSKAKRDDGPNNGGGPILSETLSTRDVDLDNLDAVDYEILSDITSDMVNILTFASRRINSQTSVSAAFVRVKEPESKQACHRQWHKGTSTDVGELVNPLSELDGDPTHLTCTLTTPKEGEEDEVWTVGFDLSANEPE